MINITIDGITKQYEKGIKISELVEGREDRNDILLAMVNGSLKELWKIINNDAQVSFLKKEDAPGAKAYERGLLFVFIKAVHDVYTPEEVSHVSVEYTNGSAVYCELHGGLPEIADDSVHKDIPASELKGVTPEMIAKIKARMEEIVKADIRFEKHSVSTSEAIRKFKANNLSGKENLFKYRRVSQTNIYELDGYTDYFYGYMPPSTGRISKYDIVAFSRGIMVVCDEKPWTPRVNLFNTLHAAADWGKLMEVTDVGELNNCITAGRIGDLILAQEAVQENRMSKIAKEIADDSARKLVMIAGPSSSGKTTFSHRMSIELMAHGLNPHPISLDNYFVDREKTPLDADGKYNFECLEALDIECFNDNMRDLLAGKEVDMPTFNFKTGKREYKGNMMKLKKGDILVIEGIHGLNDKLSYSLPRENKYKIYISALTQLNIDEHNRIPTTDGRLIRRMVRDARTRGYSAKTTISMWNSVRRGEEENIFPFQESADAMFNSALIYELAVLKQYAEPLLFGIDKSEPEYIEAKRLLKFFDYFLGINADDVPKNSIVREFVGGSYFPV